MAPLLQGVGARGAVLAGAQEETPYPLDWSTHRFTKSMMLYNENVGSTKNSVTGKRFSGTPSWSELAFADGTPVRQKYPEAQWPLQLISHKSPLQSSYSIGARRLRAIHPDNPVALHPDDAAGLGLHSGDQVYLETPGGRAKATVMVRHGVQRGVVAIEHGFGHRELGARAHRMGDKMQPLEPEIAAGINLNELGLSDPTRHGRNLFVDPVAGATVRQGLPARLVRAQFESANASYSRCEKRFLRVADYRRRHDPHAVGCKLSRYIQIQRRRSPSAGHHLLQHGSTGCRQLVCTVRDSWQQAGSFV